MTIAPYSPRFKDSGTPGLRILLEDHKTTVKLWRFIGLEITILAGLLTDGASIPQKLQIVAGGPWMMPRLLAAIVHDALYAAHWFCRWFCDVIYYLIRSQYGSGTEVVAKIEYAALRIGGRSAWQEKTPERIEAARKLLKVRLVFIPLVRENSMKKISCIIALAAVVFAGCSTPPKTRSSEATGMYANAASQTVAIGSVKVLSAPEGEESATLRFEKSYNYFQSQPNYSIDILVSGTNSTAQVTDIVANICEAFVASRGGVQDDTPNEPKMPSEGRPIEPE